MSLDSIVMWLASPVLGALGGLFILIFIGTTIYTVYVIITGVLPVWCRMGIALSRRKIAIFAKNDDLINLLTDSKLFKKKNIIKIEENSLGRAESADLFLINWQDYEEQIDEILGRKEDSKGLVVYVPPENGNIPEETMCRMNKHRNVIVVNVRGRLLNDVFISMITMGHQK